MIKYDEFANNKRTPRPQQKQKQKKEILNLIQFLPNLQHFKSILF